LRENVLRDLASRASKDPEFLRQARKDLEGTLARHGYRLTGEEMRPVERLRRQTVEMSGESNSPARWPPASKGGPAPCRPARQPRAGAVRAPLDWHDPQADCGEGV
jgi:hypothetical protein